MPQVFWIHRPARLEAALGPRSALRATVVPGNRYEARVAYEPFEAGRVVRTTRAALASATPRPVANPAQSETGTLAYRVLVPQAIDVRIKAGRPAFVGARAILEVAGPWRVDEAWWAEALDTGGHPLAHDAYDVLLDDGNLWRIVCERGRWFCCGTYD